MTDSRTLPVVGAAVTAPAWLPAVAAVLPPLTIGGLIGLGLVLLFRDDKPKPATATPDGATPPAPNPPPKQERGVLDWLFDDDAKPTNTAPAETPRLGPVGIPYPPPVEAALADTAEAERQQRLRDNEAELACKRHEIARLTAAEEETRAQLANAYAQPVAAAVTVQAAARPQLASPRPAIPAAPISAPQAAVTPRSLATPAASQAPAVIQQATPAPAASVAASPQSADGTKDGSANSRSQLQDVVAAPVPVIVKPAPGKFQLFAPKVNREDVAAIFANGKRLARKDAVAALKARGVKQTTAYNALRDGGRFAALLDVGEDGLLAFKG